jgi:hypothetical protein
MDAIPSTGGQGSAAMTVLEHVRAYLDPAGCGLLPGGEELPGTVDDGELRWAPGALDGLGLTDDDQGQQDADVAGLVLLMGKIAGRRRFLMNDFGELYEQLRQANTISYIDELLRAVASSALPRSGVREIGLRLVNTGRHPEPVKVGIALVGITGDGRDTDLLLTLGRHEELTVYCAVALANSAPDHETALWDLALSVDGWGRIQTVRRLKDTSRDDIQNWLVRDGFRNKIMNEYLAHLAATTGRLLDRLSVPEPDGDLLRAAGDIIRALVVGGPAKDVDDYADAPRLLRLFIDLMLTRAESLHDFLAVDSVARFLRAEDGWDTREARHGWTPQARQRLLSDCRQILSWPSWREKATAGLESDDHSHFWLAEQTACALGIDTFDAHWRRLTADPAHGQWSWVMQHADDQRIDQILALAIQTLPLAELGSGPAQLLGLGPEYKAHIELRCILQDLDRFPGRGWILVETGLNSPVTGVRNTALKALTAWPRSTWPERAELALQSAARAEPDEDIRARIDELLSIR